MQVKLTNLYIKNLKAEATVWRVMDSITKSFYVEVRPKSKKNPDKPILKTYQYRWRYNSKAFGKGDTYLRINDVNYISLEDAREEARKCHKSAKAGNDPRLVLNQVVKSDGDNTLTEMFKGSFKGRTGFFPEEFNPKIDGFVDSYKLASAIDNDKVGLTTASDMKSRVERYLLPALGGCDVRKITPNDLVRVIKTIKPIIKTGKDGEKYTCHRFSVRDKLYQDMQYIFNYAQGEFPEMLYSPTQGVDMKQLTKGSAIVKTHRVSTIDIDGIQTIMWKICSHITTSTRMSWQMKVATLALALTHLRPKELTGLRWEEVDFNKGLIDIPGIYEPHTQKPERRMKMGLDHIVPMSRQLHGLLKYAKVCSKKEGIVSRYVFPSSTKYSKKNLRVFNEDGTEYIDKCISISGLEDALKRMGVCNKTELTPHGWRAMASTSLNGGLVINDIKKDYESKWIEVALSHSSIKKEDGGAMAKPYNRAKYLPERIRMAQDWTDFLEGFMLTAPSIKSTSLQSLDNLIYRGLDI